MYAPWHLGGSSTISNPCHKPCQESLRELLNSGQRSYECERSICTFKKAMRQTLDRSAISVLPAELHLSDCLFRLSCESPHKMLLCSGSRRRMLASQRHAPCLIGLDITALIGCAPWCAARPWSFWTCCLALQALQVFAGPGDRYHGVRELVCAPGGLDIKGFGKVDWALRSVSISA
jgi:hypothetical protein